MIASAVRYQPGFETAEADEAETTLAMTDAMRGIVETTHANYGYPVRGVHAKSHGILRGELTVPDGLPEELRHGLFAHPAAYPVVMRYSTIAGDLLDDSISLPRGLAVKVVGVEGERLPGSEGEATQDFVMGNGPAFGAPTAKGFLGNAKLLARTTDAPQIFKKAISAVLRGTEATIEALGGKSALLTALGGHPNTHILGDSFYTQTAFLYGPYMAKFTVVPVSAALTALTGTKIDTAGHPDALREAVAAFFQGQGGAWELRVQLCTDLATMPIEDASVEWPQEGSPYIAVGRITVTAQPGWDKASADAVDLGMSFSPWHGLVAHRPLGVINRVRRPAYEMSSGFRAQHSGCPMREPRTAAEIAI